MYFCERTLFTQLSTENGDIMDNNDTVVDHNGTECSIGYNTLIREE